MVLERGLCRIHGEMDTNSMKRSEASTSSITITKLEAEGTSTFGKEWESSCQKSFIRYGKMLDYYPP